MIMLEKTRKANAGIWPVIQAVHLFQNQIIHRSIMNSPFLITNNRRL